MPESLKDFLISESAGPEAIQEATRALVGLMTDDLPIEEMRNRLQSASGEALAAAGNALQGDPIALTNACLEVLASAWEERPDDVRAAVCGANRKMPMFETAAILMAAMYGMYLVTTRGMKKSRRKVTYHPDGRYTEETTDEYYPPALGAVVELLKASVGLKAGAEAPKLDEEKKPPLIES